VIRDFPSFYGSNAPSLNKKSINVQQKYLGQEKFKEKLMANDVKGKSSKKNQIFIVSLLFKRQN
jgi:hypothetical protein